jgi:hypothetical protein
VPARKVAEQTLKRRGIPAGFRRHRAGDRGLIAAPGPLLASLCCR